MEEGIKRKAEDDLLGDKAKMARVDDDKSLVGGSQGAGNDGIEHLQEDASQRENETGGAKDSVSDTTGKVNGSDSREADSATEDDDEPNENVTKDSKADGDDGADKVRENSYDKLRFCIVENDGKPDSCVKLIGLKSLFAKQLPKMPRPYIARLVFDRRHTSLAILSDDPQHKGSDDEIIGAICYRGFRDMRFAEIAFCAVNSSHQVKGYGTKLMNLLKRHAVTEGIEYFITYADNYAIGYFKKQGFTKTISMPKGRYQGLIKDYDGGTPMECYIHPSVDFTRVPEMIQAQRDFIMKRIRLKAKSHIVTYDPLPTDFKPDLEGVSRANETVARAMAIPGVIEAGWTTADLMASTGGAKDGDRQKNALKSELLAILRKTEEQQCAWPFREPVDLNEVHDYADVIKEPIDLSTIEKRIRKGEWYKSKQMLYRDLMLMVNNCKLYNDESSPYYECAETLAEFFRTLFPEFAK